MRTARSNSRLLERGECLPQYMLGYIPLGLGLETPWPDPPTSPLGVSLEAPPPPDLTTSPWVWAWRPPLDRILDTRFWKYYLAPTPLRATIIIKWRRAPLNQGIGLWNQVIDLMAPRFMKSEMPISQTTPGHIQMGGGGIHENVKLVSSTVYV